MTSHFQLIFFTGENVGSSVVWSRMSQQNLSIHSGCLEPWPSRCLKWWSQVGQGPRKHYMRLRTMRVGRGCCVLCVQPSSASENHRHSGASVWGQDKYQKHQGTSWVPEVSFILVGLTANIKEHNKTWVQSQTQKVRSWPWAVCSTMTFSSVKGSWEPLSLLVMNISGITYQRAQCQAHMHSTDNNHYYNYCCYISIIIASRQSKSDLALTFTNSLVFIRLFSLSRPHLPYIEIGENII